MRLLNPSWLWLGLLAGPILVLYMLKLRRREVPVSSTLLWERLLRDRQANAPWQRLRRNLLLFLQLLILAALVLGLARPAIPVPSLAVGSVVVLLDATASMNATDVATNRFEAARSAARDLIDGLEGGARMTLILVGAQPQVLASAESDRTALRRALEAIPAELAPTQGAADWEAAFALAAGASASQTANGDGTQGSIAIISDGGLPAEDLPSLPGQVHYIPVGEVGENLAISALALRPGAPGPELFAQVTNYGKNSRRVILSLTLDDEFYTAQQLDLPAGERRSLTLSGLPADAVLYKAQISSAGTQEPEIDPFPLDDTAFAVYTPARGGRALLLSPGNLFLEQLLAALPGILPFRTVPGQQGEIQMPEEAFDVYILDGMFPNEVPPGDLLLINPPPNPLLEIGEVYTNTGQVRVADHPLAQYVDWSTVHVRQARQVKPPGWADVLVRSEGGPLVFAGQTSERRVAVITFDLHDSDLPLQVTFPILFSNLLGYLSPAGAFQAPEGLQPGENLTIQVPQAAAGQPVEEIMVASPSGKVYLLQLGENGVMFTDTGEIGVYAVNYLGNENGQEPLPADFFAVNLFNEAESSIQPASTIQVGRSAIPPAAPAEFGQREFWPWIAALALLMLMLEWLVYHRRIRLPYDRLRSPKPGQDISRPG